MDDTTQARIRWFHFTPGRFVIALLVVEVLLWLLERFGWLGWHKGYAVLTVLTLVAAALVGMFMWFVVALILRWRFQFSIRSLLVLMAATAIWLGNVTDRARSQRNAVEVLTALEAWVSYDEDVGAWDDPQFVYSGGQAYYQATGRHWGHADAEPSGPEWLRCCLGEDYFRTVFGVELEEDETHCERVARRVDGEVLRQIRHLESLRYLALDCAERLQDADLVQLKRLGHLERLFLKNVPISDSGLVHLTGLSRLRCLSLAGTKITDEGLVHLQSLTNLEMLELCDTRLSDAAIRHLKTLKSLKALYIHATSITKKGLQELEAALPQCDISMEAPPGIYG